MKTDLEYNPSITSFKGRIYRKDYFIIKLLVLLTSLLVYYIPEENFQVFICIITFVSTWILIIYLDVCATIKRLRDLKQNPWLTIIEFIPLIGLIIVGMCLFGKSEYEKELTKEEECNQKKKFKLYLIYSGIGFLMLVLLSLSVCLFFRVQYLKEELRNNSYHSDTSYHMNQEEKYKAIFELDDKK